MPASPPSTAPTSTPASSRSSATSSATAAGRARRAGPHQVRARPRRARPLTRGATWRGPSIARCTRLGVEALDLVQFHWWDYGVPGCIDAAGWLDDLRAAGKIRHLGVTNFDTPTLAALLDAGCRSCRTRCSTPLLDRRPGRRDGGAVRARAACRCSATAPWPAASCPSASCGAGAGRAAGEPVAGEVPVDDRRVRRLAAASSALLAVAAPRGRHGTALASARWPSPGCWNSRMSPACHRRRADAATCATHWAPRRLRSTTTTAARSGRCSPRTPASRATSTTSSGRQGRPPRRDHEVRTEYTAAGARDSGLGKHGLTEYGRGFADSACRSAG